MSGNRKSILRSQLNKLLEEDAKVGDNWWLHAAKEAIQKDQYRLIGGRIDRDTLYLARFWLTPPVIGGGSALDDYESANSVMLHRFARGDDDGALHDHPWSFTTTVLTGGYDEYIPSDDWNNSDHKLGPSPDAAVAHRLQGQTISHMPLSLHSVGTVKPGTWTLVRTGERCRDWGFHPHNKTWVHWKTFLQLDSKVASKKE